MATKTKTHKPASKNHKSNRKAPRGFGAPFRAACYSKHTKRCFETDGAGGKCFHFKGHAIRHTFLKPKELKAKLAQWKERHGWV